MYVRMCLCVYVCGLRADSSVLHVVNCFPVGGCITSSTMNAGRLYHYNNISAVATIYHKNHTSMLNRKL